MADITDNTEQETNLWSEIVKKDLSEIKKLPPQVTSLQSKETEVESNSQNEENNVEESTEEEIEEESNSEETNDSLYNEPYELKKDLPRGSIGSYMTAIGIEYQKLDKNTPFGKICTEDIGKLISPLLEDLENLYDDFKDFKNNKIFDVVSAVFTEPFSARKFDVPKWMQKKYYLSDNKRNHFNAKLKLLTEALVKRLRLWNEMFNKFGWDGLYWEDFNDFSYRLADIIHKHIPKTERKEYLKKIKDNRKNKKSLNKKENNEENSEETKGENKEEFRKVYVYEEPLVISVGNVIIQAKSEQKKYFVANKSSKKKKYNKKAKNNTKNSRNSENSENSENSHENSEENTEHRPKKTGKKKKSKIVDKDGFTTV